MKELKGINFKQLRLNMSGLLGGSAARAGTLGMDALLGGAAFLPELLGGLAGLKLGQGLTKEFKEFGYGKSKVQMVNAKLLKLISELV